MNIIPYFVTAASIVGTVANSFQKRWCFYIWLCTNAFWCIFNAANGSYAQALLYAFNFLTAAIGLWQWRMREYDVHFPVHAEEDGYEEILLDLCEQASGYQETAPLAALDALGKQYPQKPIYRNNGESALCPGCLHDLTAEIFREDVPAYLGYFFREDIPAYCRYCGQALDFSEDHLGEPQQYEDELQTMSDWINQRFQKRK